MKTIVFIGLGIMGTPIVGHLADTGNQIITKLSGL